MSVIFTARGALNQDTFEGSGQIVNDGREHLTIDLRNLYFIDSYALVTLLTIATLFAQWGESVLVRLPRAQGPKTYMARMHFFELLPDNVELDGERPIAGEHARWLVPLTRLDISAGEFGVEQIANFVYPQLPRRLAGGFTEAIAEIGMNVVQHSQAEVGFVAAQRFEKQYQTRKPPRVQLVMGDAGIGIRSSLATVHPEVAKMTDEQAILKALEPGVTSKPGIQSGVGLDTVREYTAMFQGVLRIRSDRATVVLRRGHLAESRPVPGLSGTIVAVELCSGRVPPAGAAARARGG